MRDPAEMYLDLLKKVLTRTLFADEDEYVEPSPRQGWKASAYDLVRLQIEKKNLRLLRRVEVNDHDREHGRIWPARADTMIGLLRLNNLQDCIRQVVQEDVPGDFIETGVWRGGASIFARAALEAYGDKSRRVWVADSFAGLPKPDGKYPADEGDTLWTHDELAISADEVKSRFTKYGMLDERVEFVVGWFSDTLAQVPAERFSVVRLDGDMYGSTMDALNALYHRLSPGGFLIIDDYALEPCRRAVEDFRAEHSISEPIQKVDWTGAWWRNNG